MYQKMPNICDPPPPREKDLFCFISFLTDWFVIIFTQTQLSSALTLDSTLTRYNLITPLKIPKRILHAEAHKELLIFFKISF